MLPYLRSAAGALAARTRAARRRPYLTAFALLLGIAAALGAGLAYAEYQWRAARADLAADRPRDARARLDVCLSAWPWNPDVHLAAARAARLSGDLPAAETYLHHCLKLQGGATQALQLEFLLYRAQAGELDEVAPTLIDCAENGHPEAPLILETLARAYLYRLRYRPALACLNRWVSLRPDAARAYQWRGWTLERLSRFKAAAEDYRHALELDPELVPVRLRVAEMLLEDKRAPEAVPHLEQLYRRVPEDPHVQARLGICRYFQNRPADARQLLEAAVVQLPKDPSLLIHLARLDLQEHRHADAERRLRQVLATDPSDTEALYTLSSVLQVQGRTAEAVATLKDYQHYKARLDRANKLLREVADSTQATAADYAEVGALLLEVGQQRVGLYWLHQALERDPGHRAAHAALAAHYDKRGDAQTAAEHRRWLAGPETAATKKVEATP